MLLDCAATMTSFMFETGKGHNVAKLCNKERWVSSALWFIEMRFTIFLCSIYVSHVFKLKTFFSHFLIKQKIWEAVLLFCLFPSEWNEKSNNTTQTERRVDTFASLIRFPVILFFCWKRKQESSLKLVSFTQSVQPSQFKRRFNYQ